VIADTSTHVALALWVAVGAAVALVIGSVALGVSRTAPEEGRYLVLAGLTAWLAADVALGAFGLFAASARRTVRGIVAGIALPLVCGAWLLSRSSSVRRLLDPVPLSTLIGVQIYRVAGAVFILAWAAGRMPAAFALPAGLGDIAVGLSAPFVAARVKRTPEQSQRLATVWNLAGIADLVVAVTLGALTSPSSFQLIAIDHPNQLVSRLPFVLIPVFAVPLSLLLHFVTLRRLGTPGRDPSGDRWHARRGWRRARVGVAPVVEDHPAPPRGADRDAASARGLGVLADGVRLAAPEHCAQHELHLE